ncbi:hypothetical protein [Pedobacter puniceum]|uniref:Uncharacterized protein n=1 Tax=Pedobacter puniceum TaxID=2666136 RepID=A0A7K0FLE4_9SPHI|nr:hypothetical protein [Pedobacter puniceum]MRX46632.1 hypothetical protein [Pedobacter puniceum]
MKFSKDKPEIIIFPDKKVASQIIWEEYKIKGDRISHHTIFQQLGDVLFTEDTLPDFIESFSFKGVGLNQFTSVEETIQLVENIKSIAPKELSIDTILFLAMFYDGFLKIVVVSKKTEQYLDKLIDVFIDLSARQVTTDYEFSVSEKTFERMTLEDKQAFIINETNMEGRMINKGEVMHYISDEFDVVLKGRKSNGKKVIRSGYDKKGVISLPERLSKRILSIVLEEIFEEHKKYNTKFYQMLSASEANLFELENRTKYKEYDLSNLALYNLTIRLVDYLKKLSLFEFQKDLYAFIYDFFICLNVLSPKEVLNSVDKYYAVKSILKDNDPNKMSRKRGKFQFFKSINKN